jgi:cell division transport system permease protein
MRALGYAIEEALTSLWRGRRAALIAIATNAAALTVLGALLVVTRNLDQVAARWLAAAELSIYLRDDITADDLAALERLLQESVLVAQRQYVSKEEALKRFRREFADLGPLADGFPDNPFPASFEVRVRPEANRSGAAEELVARLARLPGVADVRYDRRLIDRVLGAAALVRGVGVAIVAILMLAAALTVVNVVRLACYARRGEIEIMQLVGAPLVYVRGPFVVEGILQGGLGAALALIVLWVGYTLARAAYGRVAAEVLGVPGLVFLPWPLAAGVVLGGMAVGCFGGLIGALAARELPGR